MSRWLVPVALFAWLASLGSLAAEPGSRPNLVVIMADDFGYECVTANGGESYRTPNLDRLAAEGVRFEHCHVQPLCTPTRAQLMTGRYNIRNYVRFGTLARSETTFAHLRSRAGYATAICGKWQLGREEDSPLHFGFGESFLWQHTRRPPRYANPGLEHDGRALDFSTGEYGPDLVNDFALDFIARHKDRPFFLYYPMILTHDPFQPTPESPDWDPKAVGEKVNNDVKHFAAMVAHMDKLVGRVVARLDALGLRENTLLLFLGDNGTKRLVESRFQGGTYLGGKGTTTARGTRVPLIASWPGRIKRPTVNRDLISSVDILPTLCQAAGAAIPGETDGRSFLPRILGEAGTPREWLYMWYSPRQGTDRSVRECAFNHDWKLYRTGEVFDLRADPFEKRALKAEDSADPEAVARLRRVLDSFQSARPAALDAAGE